MPDDQVRGRGDKKKRNESVLAHYNISTLSFSFDRCKEFSRASTSRGTQANHRTHFECVCVCVIHIHRNALGAAKPQASARANTQLLRQQQTIDWRNDRAIVIVVTLDDRDVVVVVVFATTNTSRCSSCLPTRARVLCVSRFALLLLLLLLG